MSSDIRKNTEDDVKAVIPGWGWLLIFILLFILCLAVGVLFITKGVGTKKNTGDVGIYVNNKLVRTVDLSTDQTFTIETDDGWNEVTVEKGKLFVSAANCENQNCVIRGALTEAGLPIVCLPHLLIIRYLSNENGADIDAYVQ